MQGTDGGETDGPEMMMMYQRYQWAESRQWAGAEPHLRAVQWGQAAEQLMAEPLKGRS